MIARPRHNPDPWPGFLRLTLAGCVGLFIALAGAILALDPYGRLVRPGRDPAPLMDINQRYMYPQLARSGRFDSAVFGSSTVRLLDPLLLDQVLGGRFANLAMNAATPWEQVELARLFVRHNPAAKTLIFGLDRTWCDPGADRPDHKVTFRSFPDWLYDDEPANDLPQLLNFKTLEIAGRVLLQKLGRMPARVRGDGYEVFTPPETTYDLARARQHLWPFGEGQPDPQPVGATVAPALDRDRRPALDWLQGLIEALPATTRVVLLFPPLHAGGLFPPGSEAAASDEACKRAAVAAARPGTAALDYRWPSALTREDANFWDRLHYRQPISGRIVRDIGQALTGPGAVRDDDSVRILRGRS